MKQSFWYSFLPFIYSSVTKLEYSKLWDSNLMDMLAEEPELNDVGVVVDDDVDDELDIDDESLLKAIEDDPDFMLHEVSFLNNI